MAGFVNPLAQMGEAMELLQKAAREFDAMAASIKAIESQMSRLETEVSAIRLQMDIGAAALITPWLPALVQGGAVGT